MEASPKRVAVVDGDGVVFRAWVHLRLSAPAASVEAELAGDRSG